jgi:hypothetical protein
MRGGWRRIGMMALGNLALLGGGGGAAPRPRPGPGAAPGKRLPHTMDFRLALPFQ